MRARQSLILLLLGALALGGGWYLGFGMQPSPPAGPAQGSLVFPDLAPRLQNAVRVEITTKGKTMTIARSDAGWGIAERGGYVVQANKLRELLTGLTELRILEPRTSDPAQFARLGLDDPMKPDSTAVLLRVKDAAGATLAELISGHRRTRTQGNVAESVYIRRPGEERTWLAEGRLVADADPQLWFDRDIMNVPLNQIEQVSVSRDGAVLALRREDDRLKVTEPADAPRIDPLRVEDVARAFEMLTFQDVRPLAEMPGSLVGTARFVLKDGVVVTARVNRDGNDVWAAFAASGEGASKEPAERLGARLAGWAYQLGAWKEKALVPRLEDLQEPPPAAPAAPEGAAPAPPGLPPRP